MFISASTAAAAPAEPLSEEQTPFSHTARGKMSQEKVDKSQGQVVKSLWFKLPASIFPLQKQPNLL